MFRAISIFFKSISRYLSVPIRTEANYSHRNAIPRVREDPSADFARDRRDRASARARALRSFVKHKRNCFHAIAIGNIVLRLSIKFATRGDVIVIAPKSIVIPHKTSSEHGSPLYHINVSARTKPANHGTKHGANRRGTGGRDGGTKRRSDLLNTIRLSTVMTRVCKYYFACARGSNQ